MKNTKSSSGHTTKWSGSGSRVSYCPHCPIRDLSHPEQAPRVGVGPNTRIGTCASGHTWRIHGR